MKLKLIGQLLFVAAASVAGVWWRKNGGPWYAGVVSPWVGVAVVILKIRLTGL